MPTIQQAMSALLLAMGFAAMADGVLKENDEARLRMYARAIRKNCKRDCTALAPRVETELQKAGY
jgi:uncharacterized membrane protein YebE (DUF533 family)